MAAIHGATGGIYQDTTAANGDRFTRYIISLDKLNEFPAVKACWNYSAGKPDHSSPWHLPSYQEWSAMKLLAQQVVRRGYYWTTTESTRADLNYSMWAAVINRMEFNWSNTVQKTNYAHARACYVYPVN